MLFPLFCLLFLHLVSHNVVFNRVAVQTPPSPQLPRREATQSRQRREVQTEQMGTYEEVCNRKSGCSEWICCLGRRMKNMCEVQSLKNCFPTGKREKNEKVLVPYKTRNKKAV
ncbi:hypothetical protein MTO96_041818 [Rhipicephalus appendiculatus]